MAKFSHPPTGTPSAAVSSKSCLAKFTDFCRFVLSKQNQAASVWLSLFFIKPFCLLSLLYLRCYAGFLCQDSLEWFKDNKQLLATRKRAYGSRSSSKAFTKRHPLCSYQEPTIKGTSKSTWPPSGHWSHSLSSNNRPWILDGDQVRNSWKEEQNKLKRQGFDSAIIPKTWFRLSQNTLAGNLSYVLGKHFWTIAN